MLADLRIKTVDNISYVGIPLADPAYFSATNWEITVAWGDGIVEKIKDTYDSPAVAWDREFDQQGNVTASAPSEGCITLWHTYKDRGKYEIRVLGGFGTGAGANKKNNKLAFAKAEDRAVNSTPELIEEVTYWKDVSSGFFMHGQGDFQDFINLKAINCKIKPLTSSDPESTIQYDGTGSGDLFCKNTFKNCQKFLKPCQSLKLFQFQKNNIINLEGFFENCAYNGPLPWTISRVVNFKNLLKNSTRVRSFGPNWQFRKAENLEGIFQNSYFGTAKGFKLDQVNGLPAGNRYFKIIISESDNQNVIWCNDLEITGEMTDALKKNAHGGKALQLKVNNQGRITNNSEVIGLGNGKNDFLPFDFDQISGLSEYKIHVWHSATQNGTYTKKVVKVGSPNFVRVQDEAFFHYLQQCKNAKNMMKDHKGFSSNFIKRWFFKPGKNCDMEGLFEGATCEDVTLKGLPWPGAKPTTLKAFYRNTESNMPAIDNLNTSRTESIAHMFEDSKYGEGTTASSNFDKWDLQRCEDTSFCFLNASFNGSIKNWFKKTANDGKSFYDGIYAKGMFEGSSFTATSLLWGHFKPSNTARMFLNNKAFNKKIADWDMSSNTDISSMFKSSIFNQDTISDWNLQNVVNATEIFADSQFNGDIADWFDELTTPNTYKIESISGMFENSKHNGAGCRKWFRAFRKTVKQSVATFRNCDASMDVGLGAKWFAGANILENFNCMFENAPAFDKSAISNLLKWQINGTCEDQLNVVKGVSYMGKIGACKLKSFELDDDPVHKLRYRYDDKYVPSTTPTVVPSFNSDIMPIPLFDTAFYRIEPKS